jgi:hypothetical protein
MTTLLRSRYALLLLCLLVITTGSYSQRASGTDYTFTTIANNQGDPFTGLFVYSAEPLNDGGEVAFFGERSDHYQGIYKSDGSTITTIATYSQMLLNTGYSGGINDGGSVVFRGDGGAYQRALYAGSGGGLTTYLYENTTDPEPAWIITGAATINDSDQVAFSGGWISNPVDPNPVTRQGYYRVDGAGGSVTVMAESGHGVYNGAASGPPALNDAGQAAFMMSTADNGYQVIRYDNPGLTTIAGGYSGSQIVSMNSSGDVAFINQNSSVVQVYRNGGIQTVASTADGFHGLGHTGDGVFINDVGEVVFLANVQEYGGNPVNWFGVFNGPDVVNDQVLLNGDSLFDRTVTNVDLYDVNNLGQILMYVQLSGPSDTPLPYQALVLATPTITYSADFDADGDVDSDDLDEWHAAYGVNALADADGDGDSDGADFLVWQRQYGSGVTSLAPSRSVPEPGCLALIFGVAFLRRTRM